MLFYVIYYEPIELLNKIDKMYDGTIVSSAIIILGNFSFQPTKILYLLLV